jgi:hypothetical protein
LLDCFDTNRGRRFREGAWLAHSSVLNAEIKSIFEATSHRIISQTK